VTNEFTYRFEMTPTKMPASAEGGSELMNLRMPHRRERRRDGRWLLIEHAFPAQRIFESLGGLVDQAGVVIGGLDGGLRGDP
jgi:hypothetical protein